VTLAGWNCWRLLAGSWFFYAVPVETFTFLFTDVEGSTVLLGRVGEGVYARVLAAHHALIRSVLAVHGGQEVDTAGDGFFAVFSSPRGCVAAVLEMQQALAAHAWPGGELVRVRMGVHCGEAEQTVTGLVGLDVHRAARIAAVAHGGQVLVSQAVAAIARGGMPAGVTLLDLGLHRLKDLGEPEQLFQLRGPGLQAEFPPVRSLGSAALPNNLPGQLAAFIGRDRELTEVAALVAGSRLVTLTGAGGAGKTRLGLQVAADLLDGSGDGVWLVELAAVTDQGAVAATVAEALRIPPQPGRLALDVLADALAPLDLLIVLDNCEHLIGGCAKTADALLRRCPKVRLIATSREPLGIGGEVIYRVPSLSLPDPGDRNLARATGSDAVSLLADRARAQGTGLRLDAQTLPLVASVCARLDGMPLAIELAAARLRSMSLSDLAGRLDQRFRLLTGGSRTALERQQTLRAAIGWSYSLLTDAERLLLGRLSVFAGGLDLAAAEAVCGFGNIDGLDVAGLLGSLADKSLVVTEPARGGMRYRLLESIRLFAAERLAEAGEEAATVADAHCAHYLAVAEAAAPHLAGPEQGSWLDRLDTDQDNLRRAAQHAVDESGATPLVLRFGVALWRYWGARYRSEEGTRLLGPVLQRVEAAADPALFAEALVAAALLATFTDLSTSLQLAKQADAVASGLGDDRLIAWSRGMLGFLYYFVGEQERAQSLTHESVERARKLGDDVLLGWVLLAYATASAAAPSGPVYAEAITCAERSGDLWVRHALRNNAGWTALQMGDFQAARTHLEAALRAAEAIGAEPTTPSANLGWVLRAESDPAGAQSKFEGVLRIGRRIGDRRTVAGAINGLACLAADLGDWRRAAALHGAAQALWDQIGAVWDAGDARYRQESLDQIRAALGDEQLQDAYAQGMTLSFDEAIDLALRREPEV
jgi:predicted ATPase/class 3 adenylate cyclase/Tfp pilus assembly protein PilF